MKYTIEGFSQERAVELGLTAEDLVILRWFVDFWPSPAMTKISREGRTWAHVIYEGFARQMPIIGGNKRTLARKFQRLVEAGVLDNLTIREGGCYSVYAFGPQYQTLVDAATTCDKKTATYVEESTEGMSKNRRTYVEESTDPMSKNRRTNIVTNPSLLVHQTSPSKHSLGKNNFSFAPDDYEKEILDIYRDEGEPFRTATKVSKGRRLAIGRMYAEGVTTDEWRDLLIEARESSFLTGHGQRGWKADLDFFLSPDKREKLREGTYDDPDPDEIPDTGPTPPMLTARAGLLGEPPNDGMDKYLEGW